MLYCTNEIEYLFIRAYIEFKESDKTFKFTKHVSTETSVIFS